MEIAIWYAERHPAEGARFEAAFNAIDVSGHVSLAGRERTKLSRGVRAYVLHPHLLFYRIDPTARLLTVVRVIHGHRDLTADEFED